MSAKRLPLWGRCRVATEGDFLKPLPALRATLPKGEGFGRRNFARLCLSLWGRCHAVTEGDFFKTPPGAPAALPKGEALGGATVLLRRLIIVVCPRPKLPGVFHAASPYGTGEGRRYRKWKRVFRNGNFFRLWGVNSRESGLQRQSSPHCWRSGRGSCGTAGRFRRPCSQGTYVRRCAA